MPKTFEYKGATALPLQTKEPTFSDLMDVSTMVDPKKKYSGLRVSVRIEPGPVAPVYALFWLEDDAGKTLGEEWRGQIQEGTILSLQAPYADKVAFGWRVAVTEKVGAVKAVVSLEEAPKEPEKPKPKPKPKPAPKVIRRPVKMIPGKRIFRPQPKGGEE